MSHDSTPTHGIGSAAKDESDKAVSTIKEEVSELADDARQVGRKHVEQQFESGKERVEVQLDTVASAVDDAARRLDADGHPFASYAGELSTQLKNLSEKIETSSVDELASSTRRLARENPGLFMLGGVALGFVASRFFKAGQPTQSSSEAVHYDLHQNSTHGTANRASHNTPRVNTPVNDLDQVASERATTAMNTNSGSPQSRNFAKIGSGSTQSPNDSLKTTATSTHTNATTSGSKDI